MNDEVNHLYFHFLSPIVSEFERVNALFQSNDADPQNLVRELALLHKSLRYRVFGGGRNTLHHSRIDFGGKFQLEVQKFLRVNNNDNAKRNIEEVLTRCQSFLVELIEQVEKRLPESESFFDGLKLLSPKTVLSQFNRSLFMSLPMLQVCRYISPTEEQ